MFILFNFYHAINFLITNIIIQYINNLLALFWNANKNFSTKKRT